MGPVAIDPAVPTTVYAGFAYQNTLLKSTDGGRTWNFVYVGVPLGGCPTLTLAIDPSPPAALYAGTCLGLFKSTDGGENWTAFNSGLANPSVFAIAIDSSTTGRLYAGTYGGVFDYELGRLEILPAGGERRPRQLTPRK